MDTSGFYNQEFMLRAGKFVHMKDVSLLRDEHDQHTYPVFGWYWFDSVADANQFFGTKTEDWNLDLPPDAES